MAEHQTTFDIDALVECAYAHESIPQWVLLGFEHARQEIERLRAHMTELEDQLTEAWGEASGLRMQLEDQT